MSEREWRFYLQDMIGFAEKVLVYTEGLDQAAFVASGLNYDATVRNLELIGEAAMHIPIEIQKTYLAVPWRQSNSNAQPAYPRLSRDRQRYAVEHH
jgi:uncharacterized protein with HEPN domain